MKKVILWMTVLGMLSCTRNPVLERTFQRAGENRAELEKVLRHDEGSDIIRKIQAVQTVFQEDGSGWSELFSSLPYPSAAFLLEHPVGVCRELCGYVVFLFRSLGFPAVTDQYVASPQTSGAHWWNAVRDTMGRMVSFWLPESEVGRGGTC